MLFEVDEMLDALDPKDILITTYRNAVPGPSETIMVLTHTPTGLQVRGSGLSRTLLRETLTAQLLVKVNARVNLV